MGISCLIMMSFVKSDFKGVPEERIFSLDSPIADVQVAAGQKFVLKVAGNPTTGYGWFLGKDNSNDNLKCLNLDKYNSSEDYVVNQHPEGMMGVGGVYYFIFVGDVKGSY